MNEKKSFQILPSVQIEKGQSIYIKYEQGKLLKKTSIAIRFTLVSSFQVSFDETNIHVTSGFLYTYWRQKFKCFLHFVNLFIYFKSSLLSQN